MKIVFILADSADPDEMHPYEMQLYVAFSSGSHCLPKYMHTGIQNEKG